MSSEKLESRTGEPSLEPGLNKAVTECYNELIPAIVNCVVSWDFNTGEPELGKYVNTVKNLKENKMENDEHSNRRLTYALYYLEEHDYIEFYPNNKDRQKYDFENTNIYDLAELHYRIDSLETDQL